MDSKSISFASKKKQSKHHLPIPFLGFFSGNHVWTSVILYKIKKNTHVIPGKVSGGLCNAICLRIGISVY